MNKESESYTSKESKILAKLIPICFVIIPFIALLLADLSVYEYPTLFYWHGTRIGPLYVLGFRVGPVYVLSFLFVGLEIIFNEIWCPFRRWTMPKCRKIKCSLLKICRTCPIVKNVHLFERCAKQCEIAGRGITTLILMILLAIWEAALLNA